MDNKKNKTITLFMMLDHLVVDAVNLDYENLTTSHDRQQYQESTARMLLTKHKKTLQEYSIEPTFFVRDYSSMEELPVDPETRIAPEKHYLGDDEKDFIRENCRRMPVKEIAEKLMIKTSTVYHYLIENNLDCKVERQIIRPVHHDRPKPKIERPAAEYSNQSSWGYASGHKE
ncbi:MAG TPA: hypothetical protein VKR32_10280 [Puia sp.]|nr:hypothetical protein [Puia sp.]